MILNENSVSLHRILGNILWFCAKNDDAPCSAEAHLDRAIVDLVSLCPDFKPPTDEIAEIITDAAEHMKLLGYVPNKERS